MQMCSDPRDLRDEDKWEPLPLWQETLIITFLCVAAVAEVSGLYVLIRDLVS